MSGLFTGDVEKLLLRIDAKDKRIAELEAENERLRDEVMFLNKQQQLDNEDAERYRWLRDNPEHESLPYYEDGKWHFPYQIYGHAGTGGGVALRSFDTLDAAIDAAMEVDK